MMGNGRVAMADSTFVALALNAGLLLSSTLILDLVVAFDLARPSLARKLIAGTLLSLVGIAVMALPFELQPGVVFDVRSVLVSTATLFYGAVPGGMVMVASAAFRLAQGGAGTAVGVSVVLVSGALGLLFRSRLRGDLADLGWRRLLLFGLVVHGAMLVCMLGLPRELIQGVLRNISLPVLTIYPVVTVAVGQLMARRLRQERLTRDLADSEARFRSLFQDSHVMMFLIDPSDGAIVDANPAAVRHYGWTLDELRSMRVGDIDLASSADLSTKFALVQRSRGRTFLVSHRRKDGSIRIVEVYSGPVRLHHRELLYSIVVDVTERQRAAAEREEAAEQRSTSSKMPSRRADSPKRRSSASASRSGCCASRSGSPKSAVGRSTFTTGGPMRPTRRST